jgi:twinkle protein
MFAGQVALDLIAQKKRVLIASFEMQPARTLARMARQGWGSEVPNDHELATFSHWTDGKLWLFDHSGRITPSRCLAMCRYFAMEKLGHHVFIDSMMMVCASEESMDEQKQFITDLVRMAQETNLHVHLVAHCRKPQAGEDKPPTKYDLRGSAAISDQAHNVVTVWATKLKKAKLEEGGDPSFMNDPDALITVEKQRNGRWEGRCKLWFEERSMRFCDDGSLQTPVYAGLQ